MSDTTRSATDAAETVRVELDLPAGLVQAYDSMVEDRIYPSRANALLHGLVESWRHNRGSFHTLRIDLDGVGAAEDDAKTAPQDHEDRDQG